MKLAITGKGGVGKTTVAAVLATLFQRDGYNVLAIDADPDANLGLSLGFPSSQDILPIIEMKDLIEERTGAKPGNLGAYFKLNPYVADIPDKYAVQHEGIKLMVMGGFRSDASGCFCPENTFLKSLLACLLIKRDEAIILDMEPGVEHLSRGTAKAVDFLIVVVDSGRRSMETAHKIRKMAGNLGIKHVWAIGNRVRTGEDKALIIEGISPLKLLGFISDSDSIREADIRGQPVFDSDALIIDEFREIKNRITGEKER